MAGNQKPTFSFGQTGPAATSGPIAFGQTSTTSQPPSGGLFGSLPSSQPSSGGAGLFGSKNVDGGGSGKGGGSGLTFGNASSNAPSSSSGTATSNIFGGATKPATPSFSFGQTSTTTPSGTGLFGSTPASSQNSQAAGTASLSAPSIFATPGKQNDSSDQGQTPKPLFGAADNNKGGGSLFNLGASASTTTPTSKPTTSLFGNSTTPAGPPPMTSIGASSTPNPFASHGQASGSAPTETTKPSTSSSNLFSTGNKSSASLFSSPNTAPQGGSLFQNLNKQQPGGPEKQTESQQSGQIQSNMSNPPPSAPSISNTKSSTPASLFNIPKPAASASPAAPATTAAATTVSSDASKAAPGAPAGNLFGALGKPQEAKAKSSDLSAPSSTSAPNLFGGAAKPSAPTSSGPQATTVDLFSNLGKPSSTAPVAHGTGSGNAEKSASDDSRQVGTLSGSTAGPAPPAQSRLKNKSMDDIITRWATDLSKYQKEFQQQAEKVARWDRMLVDNSEKIQKLYGQTLEAERATVEVERQLSSVEADQTELETWLNHYEQDVDALIKQQGDGETATGPDHERQRTYQLAGRLAERLEEMGKDLTSMIEEINDASFNINKNSKKDDPLSQVVRILNGHLLQLQNIDQGATSLTQQIQEYKRNANRGLRPGSANSSLVGSANNRAADGFWRSYMGRR